MATEVLPINEEHLLAFVDVLEAGLAARGDVIAPGLAEHLREWAAEVADYMSDAAGNPDYDTRPTPRADGLDRGASVTHYKGGTYTILGVGIFCDGERDGDEAVIYRRDDDPLMCVRSRDAFFELVPTTTGPTPRFHPS